MTSIVVRAEKMAAGGDAIARIADGRVAFVRGALPGESVAVELVQSKKDFVRAEVVEVLEPSARACSRRAWPTLRAAAGVRGSTSTPTHNSTEGGRRRRGACSAPASWSNRWCTSVRRYRRGPIARRCGLPPARRGRLGLRGRNSHDVVELDGCPVSHPLIDELLAGRPGSR